MADLCRKYEKRRKLSLALCIWLCFVAVGFSGSAWAEDIFPGEKWEKVVSPDATGWSSQKLEAADDYARTIQTSAYLLFSMA